MPGERLTPPVQQPENSLSRISIPRRRFFPLAAGAVLASRREGILLSQTAHADGAAGSTGERAAISELVFVPDRSKKGYIYERPEPWMYEFKDLGNTTVDVWRGNPFDKLITIASLNSHDAPGTIESAAEGMEIAWASQKEFNNYSSKVESETGVIDGQPAIRLETTMPPGAVINRHGESIVDQETRNIYYAFIRNGILHQVNVTFANIAEAYQVEDPRIRRVMDSVHFVE
jgi:hypothetical protein